MDDLLMAVIMEIEAALADPVREEGEITVMEYAEFKGLSREQARHILEQGVVSGKLTKRSLKIDHVNKLVYRVAK